jgi:hypothetical protein
MIWLHHQRNIKPYELKKVIMKNTLVSSYWFLKQQKEVILKQININCDATVTVEDFLINRGRYVALHCLGRVSFKKKFNPKRYEEK